MKMPLALAVFILPLLVVGISPSSAQSGDELITLYQTHIIAGLNIHDLDQWTTDFTNDVVYDAVPSPPPMVGPEAAKEYVAGVIQGFPDFQDTPQLTVATDNLLASVELYSGTHQAEWFGIPPTGRVNHSLGLVIYEYQNGKLVRLTQYWDPLGMLVNLGVVTPPEMPPLVPSIELPPSEATGLDPVAAEAEAERRWGTHDMAEYAKIFREDAQLLINGMELTRDQYIATQESFLVSFPDLEITDVVRRQDMGDGWVVTEAVFTGTQEGAYLGAPPSGAQMVNRVGWLSRYDDQGLCTYAAFFWDNLGLLAQLGALPGGGASAVAPASWGGLKASMGESR